MKYTKDMLLESASGFVMPFPGHEDEDVQISLGYGEQTHPKTGERFHHQGLDLVAYHVPLYAIGTGVVTAVGNDVVHENFIICRYGKYEVKYGHVASVFARYGQPVEAGLQIAESGDFLHFEVRHDGIITLAVEMKEKNKSSVYVGKTPMSAQQVSQRGYDYARAAVKKQEAKRSERQTEVPYSEVQQQEELETPLQQETQTTTPISPAARTGLKGWEGLLNHLGLGGFGDIGKNLGYVLAMLPDMLISLLIGKSSSFKLGNSLLPLAAIFGGMFVRNPMMKMLLIGLGGANLLNKVGHEALKGVGITNQHPTKDYKRYADEPLNQRLQDPAMKGNTLVVQIDGVPQVVTIQSDTVLDAYHKGALPLNVLSNAVLRQYDIQREPLVPHYVPLMQEEEVQGKKMVIK